MSFTLLSAAGCDSQSGGGTGGNGGATGSAGTTSSTGGAGTTGSTGTTASGGSGGIGTGATGGGGAGACQEGDAKLCYSGDPAKIDVGTCKQGVSVCENGLWSACVGEVLPSGAPEVCNGKDEDCNGLVDDGIPSITCGVGACTVTVAGCSGGVVPSCVPLTPSPFEACEGTDDNCNGTVDEGCMCLDGQKQDCYSGAVGTAGVGQCHVGKQTCFGGQWGACVGEVVPKIETCNGSDDDCNGTVDDSPADAGNPCLTGKPGVCAIGTMKCQGGGLACVENQGAAAAEICGNGLDDDCDGVLENGCNTCAHDICTNGPALVSGCDPCVAVICDITVDPYCCSLDWDGLCVQRVRTKCISLKCGESAGTCAHTPCSTGAKLTSGCDVGTADCVSKVCAMKPSCCTTAWDASCVGAVPTACAPATCN